MKYFLLRNFQTTVCYNIYYVASEKPSCLATVAADCNVSGLASINLTTCLHVIRNEQLWSECGLWPTDTLNSDRTENIEA